MASEISWRGIATGATDYATIRSAARTYWNTSGTPALETLTVANWANYAITLTETPASSYFYVGTWPAGLTTAGWYWVDIYKRVGGSPAISDTLLGTLLVYWNGTTADPWDANLVQWLGTAPLALSAQQVQVDQSRVLDRVDYQRGHHTVAGSTFYVDGTGGNDSNAGTRAAPKKTISSALTLCTSNAHDEIILLPNAGGGPTTITESATISIAKNYVQIRGPGRDVLVTQTAGASRDVFNITASGVELSGFRIATNGASSNGVTTASASDFIRLHRLWIENVTQDAVFFNVANRCEVNNCVILAAGRDGVRVANGAGSGDYNIVVESVIRQCVGSAINLLGPDASDCRIQRNVIRNNAAGVTIAAGVARTVITDNRFVSNTAQITDGGTDTLQAWNFFGTDTSGNISGRVLGGGATAFSGVGVQADVEQWRTAVPNALISGRVDANAQVVGDKTGYALTSAERSTLAAAIWTLANAIATGITPAKAMLIVLEAVAAGKTDGATGAAGTFHIRDILDAIDRVTATVDQFGNRSAVTLNLS